MKNQIIQGDSLEVLKTLESESVDCVITSPPYWALRDYGVEGQLGLEPTFQEYITKLCDMFDEVKRVLKKEGTCWVNLGDTYSSGGSGNSKDEKVYESATVGNTKKGIQRRCITKDVQEKCLVQIPSRFAIEMTNRGWILRNKIIWHKPNCMPSSADDRFTVDYEEVFFFVKSKKYYFEQLKEPLALGSDMNYRKTLRVGRKYGVKRPYEDNQPLSYNKKPNEESVDKNKRTVWSINTKGYSEAHFATFPEKLIEPMVLAGCPKDGIVLDIFMGAGTTAVVALKQNKNYLGIELNPEYIKIAEERIKGQTIPML